MATEVARQWTIGNFSNYQVLIRQDVLITARHPLEAMLLSKKSEPVSPETLALQEKIVASYNKHAGNVSAVARELNLCRATIYRHLRKLGGMKKGGRKPVAAGSIQGMAVKTAKLPAKGEVKRYILTSAQNNTFVHGGLWTNLLAFAEHHKADILVGTYSYNKNNFGPLAVKRGTRDAYDRELWYDSKVEKYITDRQIELGTGLVWCGQMNILPTATDPLEGLETYSGRKSAIFPHAKVAMRSIATMMGEGTKFNYTTGTCTKKNYLQKKAGIKAEHHHVYGALIVEVTHEGNWWVRQLDASDDGTFQDLDIIVHEGVVHTGQTVEALTYGDIHCTTIDPKIHKLNLEMLDQLKPDYQFIHDVMEGVSVNHHEAGRPFSRFKTHLRGLTSLESELKLSGKTLSEYVRPNTEMIVVNSNHDRWMDGFLDKYDPRHDDPQNAEIYYAGNAARYKSLRDNGYKGPGKGTKELNITDYMLREFGGFTAPARVLDLDESYKICNRKIECGMHGHLGADGARGTPTTMCKIGRKANTAHTHSAGIWNGLYVAGTSTTLSMGYNHGPSSWSHSLIVTYPNGKRAIVTMFADKWRA